jgi:hypothetical protein
MSFLNRFKKSVESPDDVTPAPVLPPDAPASKPELAAMPVEGAPERRKLNVVDVPSPEATAPAAPEPVVVAPAPEPTPPPPPAVEAPKRGRPPGAKNKSKPAEVPASVVTATTQTPGPVQYVSSAPSLTVRKVTITHGMTVNLGNFNSARVDISMEGEVSGDLEAAFAELSKKVKEKLIAETEEHLKSAQLKVTK